MSQETPFDYVRQQWGESLDDKANQAEEIKSAQLILAEVARRSEIVKARLGSMMLRIGEVEWCFAPNPFGTYKEHMSDLVPMGSLERQDDEGRNSGFVTLTMDRSIESFYEKSRGFLGIPRSVRVRRETDAVERMSVLYIAAREDKTAPKLVSYATWDHFSDKRNLEALINLDENLDYVESILPDPETAEA